MKISATHLGQKLCCSHCHSPAIALFEFGTNSYEKYFDPNKMIFRYGGTSVRIEAHQDNARAQISIDGMANTRKVSLVEALKELSKWKWEGDLYEEKVVFTREILLSFSFKVKFQITIHV